MSNNGVSNYCYRIGDYDFKLNAIKWSYEDVICPNLYIIIKNLEEHYIRNENGIIIALQEVQKLNQIQKYYPIFFNNIQLFL